MTALLLLADHASRGDLRVLLERLSVSGEPEVRVVTRGSTLAVYGCVQAPEGLLDPLPVVLVMRGFALAEAPEVAVDATVQVRALLDRLARLGLVGLALDVPDVTVTAPWAGVLPPAAGWEPAGVLDAASLAAVARDGIERIAAALPQQPGEAVVRSVRRSVWGLEIAPGVPAAAAFAAETAGFLRDERSVRLARTRTWLRLSTGRGHALVRRGLGELG